MALRVFTGSYYQSWRYGGFQEYEAVAVANTTSEALGFLLETHPDTLAKHWTTEELDATSAGARTLHDRST